MGSSSRTSASTQTQATLDFLAMRNVVSVDVHQLQHPEKKIAYRRKEIRMLWNAVHFIENTLKEDPDIDIYWERPWPCIGWGQGPLLRLPTSSTCSWS